MPLVVALLALAGGAGAAQEGAPPPRPMRIWDQAPHNAFTDLVAYEGRFLCAFREAQAHVPQATGEDGRVRLLVSEDGERWTSAAEIAKAGVDLRDPKLSRMPDGRLLVVMGGSRYVDGACVGREPQVAFVRFEGAEPVLDGPHAARIDPAIRGSRDWLWSVAWNGEDGYGFLYQPVPEPNWALQLVHTRDGLSYAAVTRCELDGRPSESALGFEPDGRMVAVVRRDAGDRLGRVGVSAPPYSRWEWKALDVRLGGPALLRCADGTWILGTRGYGEERWSTVLGTLCPQDAHFEPRLELESGGDTSYPGLAASGSDVLVSYYSSHEGPTAIYAARVPRVRFGR